MKDIPMRFCLALIAGLAAKDGSKLKTDLIFKSGRDIKIGTETLASGTDK